MNETTEDTEENKMESQRAQRRMIFEAQLLTHLKAMEKRVGLLINFNVLRLTEGIERLIV